MTVVFTVAELLLGLVSRFDAETVAVSVKTVPLGAVTVAVIEMSAPLSEENDNGITVPTLQLTVPPENEHGTGVVVQVNFLFTNEQAMFVPLALLKVSPAGSRSFTMVLTAVAPPKSPTPMT